MTDTEKIDEIRGLLVEWGKKDAHMSTIDILVNLVGLVRRVSVILDEGNK